MFKSNQESAETDTIDLGDAAEETRGGVQPTHQELDGYNRIALIDA